MPCFYFHHIILAKCRLYFYWDILEINFIYNASML
nr:MAG TPA: hypothetical protein [Caudoviricetes sp.]